MNCLVCGHRLAIFRKLSLGDFCCVEHRDLYAKEHRGIAVLESHAEAAHAGGGTRVYAQFLQDEPPARPIATQVRGYGPLATVQVVAPEPRCQLLSRLASA